MVDQNGRLLSHAGGDAATGASERQLGVQTQIEDRYRQAITSLLAPIARRRQFHHRGPCRNGLLRGPVDPRGLSREPARADQRAGPGPTEGAAPGFAAATAGGIPGALSNQPPAASQVAAAPGGAITTQPQQGPAATAAPPPSAAAGNRSENYNRNFAVGREVSVTHQQTGTVKRLSVAVALRNPDGRPRGLREIQQIEELVKGAVGFDQARGDVVAINSRTFATAEEPSRQLVGSELGVDGRAQPHRSGRRRPAHLRPRQAAAEEGQRDARQPRREQKQRPLQGLRRDRHRARRPRPAPTTT